MKTTLVILPYFISWLMGFCLTHLIFRKAQKPDPFIHLLLAGGLGLGLSSMIIFFTFVIFNSYQRAVIIPLHLVILTGLIVAALLQKDIKTYRTDIKDFLTAGSLLSLVLGLGLIIGWIHAQYFPLGGWDAWEVWNFKAKFLFTAKEQWTNMFEPMLWRSSPHYPLLLPLINVWGWTFINENVPVVPMLTSIVFTVLTIGLLQAVLWHFTKNPLCFFAPLLLITLPFYGVLATSQYCDITMSFYLLAGLYCLMEVFRTSQFITRWACLAGVLLGMLTFTKPEGIVAGGILVVTSGFLFWNQNKSRTSRKSFFIPCISALALSSLATEFFTICYSPGNQTYINGLFYNSSPVTLYRLKMILAFVLIELKSAKWDGLWLLVGAGILLNFRACFRREIRVLPLFLLCYILAILLYYFTNTYFEIGWWLQVSLNRILFSLLPVFLLWVFTSLGTHIPRDMLTASRDTHSPCAKADSL